MFFTAIQKHIIEDFTANNDIVLVPYQMYIFAKDQELSKRRVVQLPSEYKGSLLGFLVIILPTKHKGGNLTVHNGNTKQEIEFTSGSCANLTIEWVAFKSNCECEILPVTEGTCTLLVYGIRRVTVKRDESKICAFCNKYPPKEETRREINFKEGIEDIVKEFTSTLRCHINEYGYRTNKIGVFLQNQYPMCKLEPRALKGVDLLIYQDFDDFDILLTPVLCCSGGIVLSKKLIELEKLVFHEHTVYSFTMDDLDRLNDRKSREMKPDEDIDFYGWRNHAEVLLNDVSIDENLYLMEPGKSFRWYHRSAMIITKRTKKEKTKAKNARKKLEGTKESPTKNTRDTEDKEMPSSVEKPGRSQKNTTGNSEHKDMSTSTDKTGKSLKITTEKAEEAVASSCDKAETSQTSQTNTTGKSAEDMASGAERVEENRKNATENPEVENEAIKDVTSVEDGGEQAEAIAAFISDLKIESDIHTSASNDQVEECRWCGRSADELDEPLRTCSQCHEAKYCSRKCQKSHWKVEHKYTCGKYAMELD